MRKKRSIKKHKRSRDNITRYKRRTNNISRYKRWKNNIKRYKRWNNSQRSRREVNVQHWTSGPNSAHSLLFGDSGARTESKKRCAARSK
jgi:hypothetical protein